jgi:hypothetical protein
VIGFRRAVLALAVPFNLILIVWMAIGRGFFGIITAWASYFMVLMAGPALLVLLTLSTILMFCQPRRPVRLTTPQAWLQVVCWLCMFVAGIAIVDFDDVGDGGGILLSLFGDNPTMETISWILLLIAGFVGATAWLALLVLLFIGLNNKPLPPPPPRWAFPPYPHAVPYPSPGNFVTDRFDVVAVGVVGQRAEVSSEIGRPS